MPNLAETITHIELYKHVPFKDHPFAVREDEAMTQTVGSEPVSLQDLPPCR